jgi:hypothetical protein
MKEFNIPPRLIGLVKVTLERVKCKVKVKNDTSEPFGTSVGLWQGDVFSCVLFNISLE